MRRLLFVASFVVACSHAFVPHQRLSKVKDEQLVKKSNHRPLRMSDEDDVSVCERE